MDIGARKRTKRVHDIGIESLGIFATLPSVWDLPCATRFDIQSPANEASAENASSKSNSSKKVAATGLPKLPESPRSSLDSKDENQEALYSARGPAPISQRKDRRTSIEALSAGIVSQIIAQDADLKGEGMKFSYRTIESQPATVLRQISAPVELATANIFPLLKNRTSTYASTRLQLSEKSSRVSAHQAHGGSGNSPTPPAGSGPGRACKLWKKLGGEKLTNRELALTAMFRDMDEFSLKQAAKDRSVFLSPLNSARDDETRSSLPTRSVSWDVGMVIQTLGLKDRLEQTRFNALNTRIQEMLMDDEEQVYTGSYGPKSLRRTNDRRVLKSLVEANPVAFLEDTATQAEEEYRMAAEVARNKLTRLSMNPDDQKALASLADSIKGLRKERPFFNQPRPLHEVPKRLEVEERKRERPKWQCETSIFAQRKKENDSRGLLDTEKVLKRQFMLDWERIVSKSRFRRLVGREDVGVRKEGQGLEEELDEIRE